VGFADAMNILLEQLKTLQKRKRFLVGWLNSNATWKNICIAAAKSKGDSQKISIIHGVMTLIQRKVTKFIISSQSTYIYICII